MSFKKDCNSCGGADEYCGGYTDKCPLWQPKIVDFDKLLLEIESLKCCGNCKHEAYEYDFFECPYRVKCSRCYCSCDFDGEKEDFWEK